MPRKPSGPMTPLGQLEQMIEIVKKETAQGQGRADLERVGLGPGPGAHRSPYPPKRSGRTTSTTSTSTGTSRATATSRDPHRTTRDPRFNVTIMFTPETLDRLDALCADYEMRRSEIVERLVDNAFDKRGVENT